MVGNYVGGAISVFALVPRPSRVPLTLSTAVILVLPRNAYGRSCSPCTELHAAQN